jgi:hypothetical protein
MACCHEILESQVLCDLENDLDGQIQENIFVEVDGVEPDSKVAYFGIGEGVDNFIETENTR